MYLIAKENRKDLQERSFKKDGKLNYYKIIFGIILFIIFWNAFLICNTIIIFDITLLFVPVLNLTALQTALFPVLLSEILQLIFITKIFKLVKYIVLAFPK